MKSYGNAQMLDLLQEAVDIGAHGEAWHHKMMLWAQSHGLQGHKRLNQYESGEDRAHYIKLQNYAIDMFGEVLEPSENFVISAPTDIKGYLEAYVSWENSVYTRLAAINGQLVELGNWCGTVCPALQRAETRLAYAGRIRPFRVRYVVYPAR